MEFTLEPKNKRVHRALAARKLSNKWLQRGSVAIAGILSTLGAWLIIAGSSLGWLLLIPPAYIVMVWIWFKGDLSDIPVEPYRTQRGILLHAALEADLLARLPLTADVSAYEIWKALENSEERFFLHNRYDLDRTFFEHLLSRDPGSGQLVWQKAFKLHEKYEPNGFPNILIFGGLITSVPAVEKILRGAGLELSDIETSIPWMNDIKAKRRLLRQKKNFGGIGRDWAYGYTPILRNLGHNISEGIQQHGFFTDTSMHDRIVSQMMQIMSSSHSTITLVGDEGVGKTTCVYAFAEQLLTNENLPRHLRYSQIVELDASTLMANAKRPGELEDLMIHILNEAHRAKNIILFFDEAQVFFGSNTGNVDLTHVLQPVFESGGIRMIFAMNPQHWQKLASSGAAARLTPVTVPPADQTNTIAVLRDQVTFIEYRHKVVFTYQALQEAFKLGTRYVTTQSMPGAALAVLQQAASFTRQQLITRQIVQKSIEQTYGIKLQTADTNESQSLLNLESELKKQVISQERAISVISNALRRSRSGVGNPDRPIGTFLFLGPTGVGKTELSKALARSYFDDEKALIRIDMNQYVEASDVTRLITPMQGNELGFLGEVRKKPFSVILLDEIEKAHSSVINTLLQMLDEGIMRDSDNKTVSFRDAIIIATSNAGADEIRKAIEEGKDLGELEQNFTDNLIARGIFAPEFVNRFDEVVLFKPLSEKDLISVIDLIVAGINKTLDAQKVQVELNAEAKQWLVSKGYDSKLGARPMRRMAQRYVENIIAKRLLEKQAQAGEIIQLNVGDFEAADK